MGDMEMQDMGRLKAALLVKLESEVLVVAFQRTITNGGRHWIHPDTVCHGQGEEEGEIKQK